MHKLVFFFFISTLFYLTACNKESKTLPAKVTPGVILSEDHSSDMPIVSIKEVTGKFNPATHEKFVVIDDQYADRKGMHLQLEAYEAFKKMHAAALSADVQLIIRSATRNFDRQKQIWEAKWTGKRLVENGENLAKTTADPKARALKILKWSSMPGSSRHHWGTDIDLNAFENSYFMSGEGKNIYDWLTAHAHEYGFCQPYTKKGELRSTGYNEEKWHWSYMPIAGEFFISAKAHLSNEDFHGFLGSETAAQIDIKQNFVLGVSSSCQHGN